MKKRIETLTEIQQNLENAISNYTRHKPVKPDTTNRDLLVLHVLNEISREAFNPATDAFSVAISFPEEILQKLKFEKADYDPYGRPGNYHHQTNAILDAVGVIFTGHKFEYEKVCTSSNGLFATITLDFESAHFRQHLYQFQNTVNTDLALLTEVNQRNEAYADIARIKGYMVSINDKLNEVSAILNDARREIVDGLDSVKRMGAKLLDLITPLTKTSKPKAGKKEK